MQFCVFLLLSSLVSNFSLLEYAKLKMHNKVDSPVKANTSQHKIFSASTHHRKTPKSSAISVQQPVYSRTIQKFIHYVPFFMFPLKLQTAKASIVSNSGDIMKSKLTPIQGVILWAFLFLLSAALHSAESAITKLSTWKVQQLVEEEGPDSPFSTLTTKMTSLLSTILITTTACSIYSTALFVSTATEIFPKMSLGAITAVLTVVTLFLGELLPKALAVSNSELVARKFVPFINRLSLILQPITSTMTSLSEFFLKIAGMRSKEETNVTEDMLRLVVNEAQKSEEGIKADEGRMIKAVLDIQDTEVSRIMQPRVDIVALPIDACALKILETALETRYSRIPVYKGGIDNVVGVVFSKDLLAYIKHPALYNPSNVDMKDNDFGWHNLSARELMQPTYYIPETMKAWNALQEMRRRRTHMAIVVDEYGGTSGLVTFEDILEEVVGEIYDEDDFEEESEDSTTIFKNTDGTYNLKASAELDDVCEVLQMPISDEIKGESSTIGGLLCSLAGEIPKEGVHLLFSGYDFEVLEVEDNRRILKLKVSRQVPTDIAPPMADEIISTSNTNSLESRIESSSTELSPGSEL